MDSFDWLVQIPLADLVKLKTMLGQLEGLQKENAQLRKELEALRQIQSQTLQIVGDLRREIRERR